jgi:ribosomal protein S1
MRKAKYLLIMMVLLTVVLNFNGCANSMDKEVSMPAAKMSEAEKKVPAAVVGEVRSVTATVAEIDYAARRATLKMPDGSMVPVSVSEAAYNFDQVKVGDLVDISLTESIAVKLEKDSVGGAGVSASSGIERAPKGQKPQGTIYNYIDVRAKVVEVNAGTRTVKLSGPDGSVFPVTVDQSVENFSDIKVGDTVLVRYTEAMAISVRPASPLE